MKQESNTAIVLAAGQGKRMHSKIQKQFLEIDHRPVLYYSLECFQKSPLIQEIILVTGEEMISYCKREIVERYHFTKVTKVIFDVSHKEKHPALCKVLISAYLCIFSPRIIILCRETTCLIPARLNPIKLYSVSGFLGSRARSSTQCA